MKDRAALYLVKDAEERGKNCSIDRSTHKLSCMCKLVYRRPLVPSTRCCSCQSLAFPAYILPTRHLRFFLCQFARFIEAWRDSGGRHSRKRIVPSARSLVRVVCVHFVFRFPEHADWHRPRSHLQCERIQVRHRAHVLLISVDLLSSRAGRCVIYMPNTQSSEKIDLLRVLGAEVWR